MEQEGAGGGGQGVLGEGCWGEIGRPERREPKLGGLGKGSGSRRSCKEPNPEGELCGVSKNREARESDSIQPPKPSSGLCF